MSKILPTFSSLGFLTRRFFFFNPPPQKAGFTLIELLVVIAIIAVLAVIGIAVFSGQQRNARDARRRADIQAVAHALEANKQANSATYQALAANQFVSNAIPQDTTTAQYCAASAGVGGTLAAVPTVWAASACPTTPAGYTSITAATPPITNTTALWRVCALLETGSNPGNIFCLPNTQ